MRKVLMALMVLMACAPQVEIPSCNEGVTAPCSCGESLGIQRCTAEGQYGACDCERSDVLVSEASAGDASPPMLDAVVAVDAGVDVVRPGDAPDVVDAADAPDVVMALPDVVFEDRQEADVVRPDVQSSAPDVVRECVGGCDDGNACTTDRCLDGVCVRSTVPRGTTCGDRRECAGTTCSACGGENQGCCGGSSCEAGLLCSSGRCTRCGVAYYACCAGNECSAGTVCAAGSCAPCGGRNQPCCGGSACSTGTVCVGGQCACGGRFQPCCPGRSCGTGMVCTSTGGVHGFTCV